MRAAWPCRICFTDFSRSFWKISISEGIFDSLFQLRQKPAGQVIELGLRVYDQQPYSLIRSIEVDYSSTTAFTSAGTCPSDFSAATSPWYYVTRYWIRCYPSNELILFVLGPNPFSVTLKDRGFGYRTHFGIIRHCRTAGKRWIPRPCHYYLDYKMAQT